MVVLGRKLWTPAALGSSLALWLDADDASTITLNGSTVSEWRDKSANRRHALMATAANQPTYNATGGNGYPVIDFDGVDDHLVLAKNFGASTTNFNVFIAARGGSSVDFHKSIVLGTADGFLLNLRVSGQLRTISGVAQTVPNIGAADVFGNYSFVATTTATLNVRVFDSGNLVSSRSFAGTGYNTNYITYVARGDSGAGATTSLAKISEIVVTLTAISTYEQQQLTGYLAHKRRLTANLPSDHPFKFRPPYM